jgi:hypothetical protein
LFERSHRIKMSFGFQNFPSFQIVMEFEFWVWIVCQLGSINLGPKGHVGHNKKLNQGFPKSTFWHLMGSLGCFCHNSLVSFFTKFLILDGNTKVSWVTCSMLFP